MHSLTRNTRNTGSKSTVNPEVIVVVLNSSQNNRWTHSSRNRDIIIGGQGLNIHNHHAYQSFFQLFLRAIRRKMVSPPFLLVHANDQPLEFGTVYSFLEGFAKDVSGPSFVEVS